MSCDLNVTLNPSESQALFVSTESKDSYANVLSRIQELVARISTQLQRFSEETQNKSQKLKQEYRVSAGRSADLERKIGKNYLFQSTQSLLTQGLIEIASKKPEIAAFKDLMQHLDAQIISSGWKWREGNLRGSQEIEKSVYNLRQTEISNEGTKSGEAKDLQQELQGLLSSIRDMYRKASS